MIAFQPYNDIFHQLSNTAVQHDRKKQKDYGSPEKLGFCTDSSLYTEKIIHSTYFNCSPHSHCSFSSGPSDHRPHPGALSGNSSFGRRSVHHPRKSQSGVCFGPVPLQIAGHQKKPHRNSKVPSLDLFEERLHKYSDSSQCHLHRLNSHMSWLQSLWSHFHTIILWQNKPLTSQVLLSKNKTVKLKSPKSVFGICSTASMFFFNNPHWNKFHEQSMNWGGYDSWQNLKSWNVIQIAPSPGYHGSQPFGEHPCQTWLALLAESHHPVVFPGANERIIDEPK